MYRQPLLLLLDGIDGLKNRSGKCERSGEGRVDGVKNRSEKCEGSRRRGDQRVKEPEWEMWRTGGVRIDSCLKRKVFLKNQKHQPNIVEITHPCIMHGAHTSILYSKGRWDEKWSLPWIRASRHLSRHPSFVHPSGRPCGSTPWKLWGCRLHTIPLLSLTL